MSEITYQTTTGRYGAAKPSDPIAPNPGENYLVSLESSAAADGILFWFWRLEKVELPAAPPTHILREGVSLCGTGSPGAWPPGENWSDEIDEITCPQCLKAWEAGPT